MRPIPILISDTMAEAIEREMRLTRALQRPAPPGQGRRSYDFGKTLEAKGNREAERNRRRREKKEKTNDPSGT